MHRMLIQDYLSWDIETLSFLIILNLDKIFFLST